MNVQKNIKNELNKEYNTVFVKWTYQDIIEYNKRLIKEFERDISVQYIEETDIGHEHIITTYNKNKEITHIIKEIYHDEETPKSDNSTINSIWISFEWTPTETDTSFRKVLENIIYT